MTTLYRAHPVGGLTEINGITSWSTSRAHAAQYAEGHFTGFGGPHLYVAEVRPAKLADLRPHDYPALRDAVLEMGVSNLDDYGPYGYLHELLREVAHLFQVHGYDWLAFCDERPISDVDEWLHLGPDPVPVKEPSRSASVEM